MKITIAITGASGSIYALRLVEKLIDSVQVEKIYVVMTSTACKVAQYELGKSWFDQIQSSDKIQILSNDDFFTPIASGSNCVDAMVILPCSMGMIARVANGISNDLISRAADVMIKERKKLIVVPRETPYSLIHLENMVRLTKNSAIVLPASVSFYSKPNNIEDLINTVVERILLQLGVEIKNYSWQGNVL